MPAIPMLVDIGANLAHESFHADLDAVLRRAAAAGVGQIVVTGSCASSSRSALDLAERYPGRLFATAGLHPHHAQEWNPGLGEDFRGLAGRPGLVALGECGLDYFRDLAPRPAQRAAFAAQLELAAELGKPVFLHERDAHTDFIALLREHRSALGPVVVHCFTGSGSALEDYLALGCHIGITGWVCDERRGRHLLDLVGQIPDSRLMIETDAPYLVPRTAPKMAHRRNEPALLPWVVKTLACARQQAEADVAATTTRTAQAFFSLPEPPPAETGDGPWSALAPAQTGR